MVDRQTIDAKILSRMFLAGAKNLEAKKEWINELNVFPVPDGDTGTNMTLTIMSAASEVSALADPDMETLAKAISSGSLRGARGNSGVILSQLLRGFTKGTKGHKEMDAVVIAAAMEKAVETAYKAVMKPKEGTILTVAREAAVKATEIAEESANLELFFRAIFEHAEKTLARTPEMLPVLKEAGVVDSGLGQIIIDTDVIATYAGSVAVECFGIIGMAAVSMKDGLVKLLRRDSLQHGINVKITEDNKIRLDFHVIVAYGVNISTIADNLVNNVKYNVEAFTGMEIEKINIYVEGVRAID